MFISICIVLVVFCVVVFVHANNKKNKQEQSLYEKLKNIPFFSPTKTIIKYSVLGKFDGLSIDDTNKQVCLIKNGECVIKPFTSIIECQIVIDGKTITKTSRGSQVAGMAIGGMLGGGLGVLIGGLSGSTYEQKKIKNVSIKLLLNDLSLPSHEFSLVDVSLDKKSNEISIALKDAEEWDNILKIILFQGKDIRRNQ